MEAESSRPKGQEDTVSALNAATEAINLAEKTSSVAPAQVVFGSVGTLIALIRVRLLFFSNCPLQVHM